MNKSTAIAPLQLLVALFDKPVFSGTVAAELKKARKENLIRVVDGLMLYKDASGNVQVHEKSDLTFEEVGAYGEALGTLIGLASGSEAITESSAKAMKDAFEERYQFGLDKEDIQDIVDEMPNDSAAMFLLIEHIWARPIRDAIRQNGGMLVSQDFLSPELLIGIGALAYGEAVT